MTTATPIEPSVGLPRADRWWPLQPLLDAVGLTAGSLSGRLGVAGNQVTLADVRGLTDRQADEWAIGLGLHPMLVWGWAWIHDANRAAGRPAYVRVAAALRRDIEWGHLRPGDELPSVRDLAGRWGVCALAITTAVDELRSEGLITRREHRGQRARVADAVADAA